MMVGLIDTSAAMLLAGARPGQLLNVCGSTDVLALCTDQPRPHERLLTRALGVGKSRWVSVSTLAAAGSALLWARQQLFADLPPARFRTLLRRLAARGAGGLDGLSFDPYLAGERTSIEQRRASVHRAHALDDARADAPGDGRRAGPRQCRTARDLFAATGEPDPARGHQFRRRRRPARRGVPARLAGKMDFPA